MTVKLITMDLNEYKSNQVQNHVLCISMLHVTITVADLSSVVYPQMLPPHNSQYNFRQGKSWMCNIYFT